MSSEKLDREEKGYDEEQHEHVDLVNNGGLSSFIRARLQLLITFVILVNAKYVLSRRALHVRCIDVPSQDPKSSSWNSTR